MIQTALPAARRRSISAGSGQPNVNETTGTGSASSRSTFAAKPSSSERGSPASSPSRARNASIAAGSASVGVTANTLTPNGAAVSSRVAAMAALIASGVL